MPAKKPAASTLQQRAEAFLEKYRIELSISCEAPMVIWEPDDLVLGFNCDILLHAQDVDQPVLAGTFQILRAQFALNADNPTQFQRFDILDAHSQDLSGYIELLGDKDDLGYWSATVEQLVDVTLLCDLLVLDRGDIKPEFRGNGLGLMAARRLVETLANQSLVAFLPHPPRMDEADPLFQAAREKLRFYWSRLGAKQVPGTDIWILSPVKKWPTFEQMLSELPHGKHPRARPGRKGRS